MSKNIFTGMPSTEIELKLELPDAAMARVRCSGPLRKLATGQALRRKLTSIYFDTGDLSLRHAGVSLRVRRVGNTYVQTVKVGTGVRSGLSMPVEIEDRVGAASPVIDAISDAEISRLVADLIGDHPLEPVVETQVWRSTRNLDIAGEGLVEVAFDNGCVSAAGQSCAFSEVELEFKSGKATALLSAAEQLFSDQPFTVSTLSKAQRGFVLIDNTGGLRSVGRGPQKFSKPNLSEAMSEPEALRSIGGASCEQVLGNWQELFCSDDPEVPHQLRVGLRRLRTALRVFRPLTETADMKRMAVAARDLGRVVSPLRDADVVWEDVCEPAINAGADVDDPEAIREALDVHRQKTRQAVREELGQPGWSWFKLNCILFSFAVERAVAAASSRTNDGGVLAIVRRAIRTSWRRTKRWGREIDTLSIEERHEMRKALKSLRYATEFFVPLMAAAEAQEFLKRLKKLQDVFGYLNDVALTNRLPMMISEGGSAVAGLNATEQAIHDWHQSRADVAWQEAKERWLALDASVHFWKL